MFIELTIHGKEFKEPIPVRRIKHWDEHVDGGSRIFLTAVDGDCEWGKSFHAAESPAAIRSALLKAGLLVVVGEEAANPEPKPKHVVRLRFEVLQNGWVQISKGDVTLLYGQYGNLPSAKPVVERMVRAIAPDAEIVWENDHDRA